MTTMTLCGLSSCDTSVKVRHWLSEHGVDDHSFVDYRDHSVPAASLVEWTEKTGGCEKLVNRVSMTWRNLPEKCKAIQTVQQWIALIAEYSAVVRRPVTVSSGGQIFVGFNQKR